MNEKDSTSKIPLAAGERKHLQRKRQQEKDLEYQKKENECLRKLRKLNRIKINESEKEKKID